jgi:RNA polymerase sigma-70 factor (ECF subfamily)
MAVTVAQVRASGDPGTLDDFEPFYRAHFRQVWRLLRRLGVREANLDDAVQDVFLVVHRRRDDFDGSRSARGWVYGIALKVASEHRRRHSRLAEENLVPILTEPRSGPEEQSAARQRVALLHSILTELSDEQRAVFVLAELEQFRITEIAELLGININTAYARHRAARKLFATLLAHHEQTANTREEGPQ